MGIDLLDLWNGFNRSRGRALWVSSLILSRCSDRRTGLGEYPDEHRRTGLLFRCIDRRSGMLFGFAMPTISSTWT